MVGMQTGELDGQGCSRLKGISHCCLASPLCKLENAAPLGIHNWSARSDKQPGLLPCIIFRILGVCSHKRQMLA